MTGRLGAGNAGLDHLLADKGVEIELQQVRPRLHPLVRLLLLEQVGERHGGARYGNRG